MHVSQTQLGKATVLLTISSVMIKHYLKPTEECYSEDLHISYVQTSIITYGNTKQKSVMDSSSFCDGKDNTDEEEKEKNPTSFEYHNTVFWKKPRNSW